MYSKPDICEIRPRQSKATLYALQDCKYHCQNASSQLHKERQIFVTQYRMIPETPYATMPTTTISIANPRIASTYPIRSLIQYFLRIKLYDVFLRKTYTDVVIFNIPIQPNNTRIDINGTITT